MSNIYSSLTKIGTDRETIRPVYKLNCQKNSSTLLRLEAEGLVEKDIVLEGCDSKVRAWTPAN